MKTERIVAVEALNKVYPMGDVTVTALDGVTLAIEKGEFLAVSGPSGSGKTTLMNMIGLIDRPDSGKLLIDGIDLTSAAEKQRTAVRRDTIGFVFQSFNLISVLNVEENVEMPLMLGGNEGLSGRRRRSLARQALESVGLSSWARHKPHELSGGQRQRVAIARALIREPKLILADEPTANLDSDTGESVLLLMKELNETRGMTFVFSTHDPAIQRNADRILNLKDGRLR